MMKQRHSRGFVVLGESLFTRNSRRVNELALRNGLASMWPLREGVDTGGLMSYGTNVVDLFRRAATYVDISKHVGRVNRESIVIDAVAA
jgi:hypothetical protein